MRIEMAARSDIGMKRQKNEDSLLVAPELNLFAIFDGMGGHAAGEVASGMGASELRAFFELEAHDSGRAGLGTGPALEEARLVTALKVVNARIFRAAEADRTKLHMGTTGVVCNVIERDGKQRVLVAHVGDSRAYRLRGANLHQLTADHSLVEEYVRMGAIKPEERKTFPHKNVILRSLGQEQEIEVEVHMHDAQAGDVFFLCSDGLSGMVEDDAMRAILLDAPDLDAAAASLIEAANANGGQDNSTVVLLRFLDAQEALHE